MQNSTTRKPATIGRTAAEASSEKEIRRRAYERTRRVAVETATTWKIGWKRKPKSPAEAEQKEPQPNFNPGEKQMPGILRAFLFASVVSGANLLSIRLSRMQPRFAVGI